MAIAACLGVRFEIYRTRTAYNQVWNDRGSGAHVDVALWRPVLEEGEVFFGDHARSATHAPPVEAVVVGKAGAADSMRPPVGFRLVWTQARGRQSLWVWQPVAPPGFVALGCVGTVSSRPPTALVATLRCLAESCVTPCAAGRQIWNDAGSGGTDGAFWELPGTGLCLIGGGTHMRPGGPFFTPSSLTTPPPDA